MLRAGFTVSHVSRKQQTTYQIQSFVPVAVDVAVDDATFDVVDVVGEGDVGCVG